MSSGSYPSLFGVWSRTSSMLFESFVEANRAAIASMGVPARQDEEEVGDPDRRAEKRIEPGEDLPEWEVAFHGDDEALEVGDRICFTKTLTAEDVDRFAAASGDTNPIHLDDEWASETRFGGRIVHGILASGLISAALARLPGSVIYLSQDVEFRAPVRLGDRVTAEVKAVESLGGGRFRLRTLVRKDDDIVIDGEAVILVD
ncbi:acyl dehydratase [Halobacteriales archaeon QS_5_70_15]|nr:MAG: acyl dehydratase [Halobacteriales archaeon QS_5_70_15]